MLKVAVLDDYVGQAMQLADWTRLDGLAQVTVFNRHLSEAEAARELQPFDVICTVRERMALPGSLIAALPNLKLITVVGPVTNLDYATATARGVRVGSAGLRAGPQASSATPETVLNRAVLPVPSTLPLPPGIPAKFVQT